MYLEGIEHILDLLSQHERTARRVLNMVPSENSMSALAKLPMLLDVYHRYFFNTSLSADEWNFRGSQDVAELETHYTARLLRELTGAEYVNLRPLSGLSGMAMVLSALGGPQGSKVLTVSPDQGGHYATSSLARRLGLTTCFITGPNPHTIDYEGIAATIQEHRPGLIYIDQSNCLFPINVENLVAAARSVAPEILIHVDVSHWMGLVLGEVFPNPLAVGADSFGGSMHKTFPGPQKAIVVTNRKDLWERIYQAQYEMISSHHFAATISLGIALEEFKECGGRQYAARLVQNTKALGDHLHQLGLKVEASDRNFSCGHQLWIRTSHRNVDAYTAGDRLYQAGIRVNAFPELPGIPERVIRIGVNEATFHGLQLNDMRELAEIFVAAVLGQQDIKQLAECVAALRARYFQPFCFPSSDPRLLSQVLSVVRQAMAPDDFVAIEEGVAIPAAARQRVSSR